MSSFGGHSGRTIVSAVGIALVLTAAATLVELTNPIASPATGLGGKLSAVQAKQIDLIIDMSKLFINWAFAVVGINGYFLKSSLETKFHVRPSDLMFCELAAGIALVSLVFGQMALSNVVGLLHLDQFSAASPGIARYVSLQYKCLVAAVVTTFASAHTVFWSVDHENTNVADIRR